MCDDENANGREEHSLLDTLGDGWLKLPYAIMADVGSAVQTLGGLLEITNHETFVPTDDIAQKARVPLATARKHLVALHKRGWINNQGRQKTRRGRPRRTSTITITKKTRDHLEPYGILPWWFCGMTRRTKKIPWAAKAVLSVVMARLCSLKAAVEQQDGHGMDADEMVGSIENLGGDDRFRFSLRSLSRDTGLDHKSVTTAKNWLAGVRIVKWAGNGENADLLAPNSDFRVIVTPASPGHVWLDFKG